MLGIFLFLLLGLIPAFIAQEKGRSFVKWYIYGALLFIIALIHSLTLKNDAIRCPKCLSSIHEKAQVCKYCTHKLTENDRANVYKDRRVRQTKLKKNLAIFAVAIFCYWLIFILVLHTILHAI
ncbi:MAG TPA: hypothetical protein VLG12_03880 [Candidatus Saccharimonadales bacterium]|nr:hypothetical protein [Candidatus Saccharimonadales bacterium]